MADAASFPLYYPEALRPAFEGEAFLRRLGQNLLLGPHSRLLVLCGIGRIAPAADLARGFGCTATLAVPSKDLDAVTRQVSGAGLEAWIRCVAVDGLSLPFDDGAFDAVFVDLRSPARLEEMARAVRRVLTPKGRVCLSYPVRVGRPLDTPGHRFWAQRLGEPLPLPRETLATLERTGYEPQVIETLSDAELDDFYRQLETALQGAAGADPRAAVAREELGLYRAQGSKSLLSFSVLVARRREPGEKPPIARGE